MRRERTGTDRSKPGAWRSLLRNHLMISRAPGRDARNTRTMVGKSGSRPVSRVLSWTVIHLGRPSPDASSSLPGCDAGHTMHPYLALLRTGFTLPRTVTSRAVRSYRTISPLPVPERAGPSAVCFLRHFPSARAAQVLPGVLPCGARTFLHATRAQRPSGRLPFPFYPRPAPDARISGAVRRDHRPLRGPHAAVPARGRRAGCAAARWHRPAGARPA